MGWRDAFVAPIGGFATAAAMVFLRISGMVDRSLDMAFHAWQAGARKPTVVRPGNASGARIRVDAKPANARAVVIDGDTFPLHGEKIRILAIDTPESFQSRCEHEFVLALEAKARSYPRRARSAFGHLEENVACPISTSAYTMHIRVFTADRCKF